MEFQWKRLQYFGSKLLKSPKSRQNSVWISFFLQLMNFWNFDSQWNLNRNVCKLSQSMNWNSQWNDRASKKSKRGKLCSMDLCRGSEWTISYGRTANDQDLTCILPSNPEDLQTINLATRRLYGHRSSSRCNMEQSWGANRDLDLGNWTL